MFRNITKFILSLSLLVGSIASGDAKVDPSLMPFVRGEGGRSVIRVIALLKAAAPYDHFNQASRYNYVQVQRYMVARSKASFAPVWAAIEASSEARSNIHIKKVHTINNSFSADVTRDGLKFLSFNSNISKIYLNGIITYEIPVKRSPGKTPLEASEMPYDFKEIGLDKVITEMPKVTGAGVIVGHVDTGVDGKHPAFKDKILSFFNGSLNKTSDPIDFDRHGTHTAGTILGGDRTNLLIGVAPGAKLVSAGALINYDTMLEGMKWVMDPDGNPETKDAPRVISNSWNCSGAPDLELFYSAIAAWEATGILPVFSAGNAGPSPNSITRPHEHPAVFAVAATGPDGKVARFSSRGPGNFRGRPTEKPDVSAPGVDINSSVPGGRYETMSGTSMAAPHVAGAVALLIQLKPDLTPIQIRELLVKSITAPPEGSPTWNPNYGFGKLNIYTALKSLVSFNRKMLGLGDSSKFGFSSLLVSPEDETLSSFDQSTGYDAFSPFPRDMEGLSWLSANEIF